MHTPVRDPRLIGLGAFFAAFTATASPAAAAPLGSAHRPDAPGIVRTVQSVMMDFSVTDVTGAPGRPIPLKIEIDGGSDSNPGQLFLLTGIPDGVTLNLGGFLGDFWAVNSKVIDRLTLTAPDDFYGSFAVRITQSGGKPGSARTASFMVTVGEPRARQTAATRPDAQASTAVKRSTNEQMLLTRGREQFQKGDVSGARVIFEYLALQGSPAAAIAMGETYDPLALGQLRIKGLEADAERALLWYQKADELGSGEARGRLKALAKR